MAELIIDGRRIDGGETFFAIYVDRVRGTGPIVAELDMDLVGPVTVEQAQPRRLSGFELPASEMMERAQRLASERGVRKILLVDPRGLMSLARIGSGDRR